MTCLCNHCMPEFQACQSNFSCRVLQQDKTRKDRPVMREAAQLLDAQTNCFISKCQACVTP
jgi:hypothetical protein